MNESTRVDAWIRSVLKQDVGAGGLFAPADDPGENARVSGVWSDRIGQDAPLPAIRYNLQAPHDVAGVAEQRIMVNLLYLVVVTGVGSSYFPLQAAADRVDEILQRGSGAVTGLRVLQCAREEVFRLEEAQGDVEFRHLGGMYRIYAHKE